MYLVEMNYVETNDNVMTVIKNVIKITIYFCIFSFGFLLCIIAIHDCVLTSGYSKTSGVFTIVPSGEHYGIYDEGYEDGFYTYVVDGETYRALSIVKFRNTTIKYDPNDPKYHVIPIESGIIFAVGMVCILFVGLMNSRKYIRYLRYTRKYNVQCSK